MKSPKFMAFAAVVVLVVGYAVYDYKSQDWKAREKSEAARLLEIPPEQVAGLALTSENSSLELKKDTEGWKLVQPVQDLADQNAVQQFVEGLSFEKEISVAVEGDSVERGKFGLDNPKGVLTVIDNAGRKIEYRIGSMKNYQGDAYLQKNNELKVRVVSSTWFAKMEKKVIDFRDKRLMRLPNSKVTKVRLEQGSQKIELEKREDQWILAGAPNLKLDQNKVREVLAMLNNSDILEYIVEGDAKPEELKAWGFSAPVLKLAVEISEGSVWKAEIAVGKDHVNRVRVHQPPFILKISPEDTGKLTAITPDSLRDRMEPFHFDKAKVEEIEIRTSRGVRALKAKEEKAQSLLGKLSTLRVKDFKASGASKLENEIILKSAKDKVFEFRWGALRESKEGKEHVAQSSLYPEVFTLDELDVNSLNLEDFFKEEGTP